jgi:hypothetical protein
MYYEEIGVVFRLASGRRGIFHVAAGKRGSDSRLAMLARWADSRSCQDRTEPVSVTVLPETVTSMPVHRTPPPDATRE